MLKVSVQPWKPPPPQAELLALSLFEGEEKLEGVPAQLDSALGGALSSLIQSRDITGKPNQTLLIYTHGRHWAKRVLLVGLGKRGEFELEGVRGAAGKQALQVRDLGLKSFVTILHGEGSGLSAEDLGQAVVEGSELALYSYSRFKTDKEKIPKEVEALTIMVQDENLLSDAGKGVERGRVVADAVKLARDLANAPSNDATPGALAEAAARIAKKHRMKCTVMEREEAERLGMGGFTGVAKGSQQPPKFIVLEYRGGSPDAPPVALVGKAITFDSGGISLKPHEKMEEMKYDKSGGCAVIAAMQAAAELKFPINLVGLVPATENLPSGSAYKPGDVLRLYSGKTAEIISTDAEGRLVLADALAYGAVNYKPEAIIDLATLTGACVIALGANISGLLGNNQDLIGRVNQASQACGEKVWQLPLTKEYYDQIKSEVADMKNSGGRGGGAITAAAFLAKCVENVPWAHLDIAGTAWTQEGAAEKTYIPKGATGVGVRLLVELLRCWPQH